MSVYIFHILRFFSRKVKFNFNILFSISVVIIVRSRNILNLLHFRLAYTAQSFAQHIVLTEEHVET